MLQPWVVTGERGKMPTQGEIEAAKAEELERFRHENPGDNRTIHFDVQQIVTGVVRSPEFGKSAGNYQPVSSAEEEAAPPERPAPRPPTPKEYVRAQIEPGDDDGYPGRVAEGRYWTEYDMDPAGRVVVERLTGEFVSGRSLHGQDAELVARKILKEKSGGYRRLDYPPLGNVREPNLRLAGRESARAKSRRISSSGKSSKLRTTQAATTLRPATASRSSTMRTSTDRACVLMLANGPPRSSRRGSTVIASSTIIRAR